MRLNDIQSFGFKKVGIEDKRVIEKYLSRTTGILSSYSSFASIICWDFLLNAYSAVFNDLLCILTYDTITGIWTISPPYGRYDNDNLDNIKGFFSTVGRLFSSAGEPLIINDVKGWMLDYYKKIDCFDFRPSFSVDLSDYIYFKGDFDKHVTAKNGKYLLKSFTQKYDYKIEDINENTVKPCMELFERLWAERKHSDYAGYSYIKNSTESLFKHYKELGLLGVVVIIDGSVVGYLCFTKEGNELLIHLKMNDYCYSGITEFMFFKALELYGQNCEYINYEEDMGIEGLRKHKARITKHSLFHNYTVFVKKN